MLFRRNRIDQPSVSVEERGLMNDGQSDEAIATITGSYPQEDNIYLRNKESEIKIFPLSGLGQVIVRTNKKRRLYELKPDSEEPIIVEAGEGYCYNPAIGQTVVVRLVSTPAWNAEQYDTVVHIDVN